MKKQNEKSTNKSVASKAQAFAQTSNDFKNALLILSLTANVYILCLWVAVQVTSRYDESLVSFFFNR